MKNKPLGWNPGFHPWLIKIEIQWVSKQEKTLGFHLGFHPGKKRMTKNFQILLPLIFLFSITFYVHSQELEPRNLTNVPVGVNFMVLGYGYSQGNVLLDPAVPIEGLNAKLNALVAGYVRSINLFGMSGKVEVLLPFAGGDWYGQVEGIDSSTFRTGFGDPSARLSVNFSGAPALKASEYKDYEQKTIVGASIRVITPFGQYFPSRLINLGSNRWTFVIKGGASRKLKNWFLEGYLGAWIFTTNNDFYGGKKLQQRPFFTGLIHGIRSLPKNMWIAANVGYGIGGRTKLNDEIRNFRMSTMRFGITYAINFLRHHTLKLTAFSGVKFEEGPDFDSAVLVYIFRWIRKSELK
jgi:hypothetical protein